MTGKITTVRFLRMLSNSIIGGALAAAYITILVLHLNPRYPLSIGAVAALPALGAGDHRLHYRNVHQSEVSVYLANALVPVTDRVTITRQERDVDQRDLVIAYTLSAAQPASAQAWIGLAVGAVLLVGLVAVRKWSLRNQEVSER